jgi:hypothetical protein
LLSSRVRFRFANRISFCAKVILPVDSFSSNGQQCLNSLSQPRGPPQPGDNTLLAAAQPARFYLPAYIGPRGWIALRLDRGKVDWDEVAELVTGSYRLTASARLVKSIKRG